MLILLLTIVSAVLLSIGVIGTLRSLRETRKFYAQQVFRARLERFK